MASPDTLQHHRAYPNPTDPRGPCGHSSREVHTLTNLYTYGDPGSRTPRTAPGHGGLQVIRLVRSYIIKMLIEANVLGVLRFLIV